MQDTIDHQLISFEFSAHHAWCSKDDSTTLSLLHRDLVLIESDDRGVEIIPQLDVNIRYL